MEERFGTAAVQPEKRETVLRHRRHWLVAGLLRLALILALATGASIALGFLLGMWRDWDAARSVTLGLYIGGAALVGVGVLSWGGVGVESGGYVFYEDMGPGERMLHQSRMGAYVLIGIVVIGFGVLAEMFLG
jgi:hypothetical protein